MKKKTPQTTLKKGKIKLLVIFGLYVLVEIYSLVLSGIQGILDIKDFIRVIFLYSLLTFTYKGLISAKKILIFLSFSAALGLLIFAPRCRSTPFLFYSLIIIGLLYVAAAVFLWISKDIDLFMQAQRAKYPPLNLQRRLRKKVQEPQVKKAARGRIKLFKMLNVYMIYTLIVFFVKWFKGNLSGLDFFKTIFIFFVVTQTLAGNSIAKKSMIIVCFAYFAVGFTLFFISMPSPIPSIFYFLMTAYSAATIYFLTSSEDIRAYFQSMKKEREAEKKK